MIKEWPSLSTVFLAVHPAFQSLDPIVLQELVQRLEPINLRAGDTLFTCGDEHDAMYFVMSGRIKQTAQDLQGNPLPPRMLSAGQVVGEISLVADGLHSSTAQVLDDARVLRLSRIAFKSLCEKYPEAVSRLPEAIAKCASETLLAGVICDLLGELDDEQLAALLAEMECLHLKRGEALFHQGEPADSMFIVVYGHLRMVATDADGTETLIDEIGRGDAVGQRSLLTGEAHSTTVYALSETAVGAITRPVFENLKRQYPDVTTRLARIAQRRRQTSSASFNAFYTADAVSFAIIPIGARAGSVPLEGFTEQLVSALSAGGSILHLSSGRLDDLLGTPGISQVTEGNPAEPVLSAWIRQQEQSHCYVVYQADPSWSPWTERCLQMADRVLLVGRGGSAPLLTELDRRLAQHSDSTSTELVLLQPDHISRPSGTAAWLDRYPAAGHHHIRLGCKADFDSFIRRITGHGLGLVLGGGGARGFAHIGVFKALAECGVDVDFTGGTSMGAVLGAIYAMGMNYRETLNLARRLASPLKLFDPTIPVVSFFASGKVTQILEQIYGDIQIEDLWRPFFCVSSNLTRAVAMVHRRGSLWQAVRASMAIPGVFSPILYEGDLLVDGCVLNNLPIDVMQRLNHDGPIVAVNVFPDVDLVRDYRFGPSVSGLQTLAAKLNPLRHPDGSAPLLFESLVRVLALNDVKRSKTKSRFADIYIRPPVEKFNVLDFGAFSEIASIGYRSAMAELGGWDDQRKKNSTYTKSSSGEAAARHDHKRSITAPLHKTLDELEALLAQIS